MWGHPPCREYQAWMAKLLPSPDRTEQRSRVEPRDLMQKLKLRNLMSSEVSHLWTPSWSTLEKHCRD